MGKFGPVLGSEQGKVRPCLVIQNDLGNSYSSTTIVAAITSKEKKEYPFMVRIAKGEGNLREGGMILLDQIRTVSIHNRFRNRIGFVSPVVMAQVNQALCVSLAL